jgi:hypothetical protein
MLTQKGSNERELPVHVRVGKEGMNILKLRNTHRYKGDNDINTDLEETCY